MKVSTNILALSFILVVAGSSALSQEKPARNQYFAAKFDNEKYLEPVRN